MMNTTPITIEQLLAAYEQANPGPEQSAAKIQLLKHYYFLAPDAQVNVAARMQPLLDELAALPTPGDPLTEQAERILTQLAQRHTALAL